MKAQKPVAPLADRVTARSRARRSVVDEILAAHAVPASHVPAPRRSLRVERLRLRGTKTGVGSSGPFDASFRFPAGVVMAVGPNLRGKTSLLEILALCLRGEPRELQRDVAAWLSDVECDIELNGRPVGLRLAMSGGAVAAGHVLEADDFAELEAAGTPNSRVLLATDSAEGYGRAIDAFMLDRLGLEPLLAAVRTGGVQTHRWPSYFGALYPPAGRDPVLIGETTMAGLAGRLLSVFLDLPGAALLTRVKTASATAKNHRQAGTARHAAAVEAAGQARREQEAVLSQARAALDELDRREPAPSASQAAGEVTALAGLLADAKADWQGADALYRQAKGARQYDERALNDHRESAVARALFHGLDPAACPRCETPVEAERKAREASAHQCAVCASPVAADDDQGAAAEAEAELAGALTASREAEAVAMHAFQDAEIEVSGLTERVEAADADLRAARDAAATDERSAFVLALARAEGALSVLPAEQAPVADDPAADVLAALAVELEGDLRDASKDLFEALGEEIAALAHEFGIESVTAVSVDRRAALKIEKGGADAGGFSAQSPGERLRLRIATVLALLRVGQRRAIATHPGLLMLDSLRAEEVQEADAAAVLDALIEAAKATPGLQILTTSADQSLPLGRLGDAAVIGPDADGGALW